MKKKKNNFHRYQIIDIKYSQLYRGRLKLVKAVLTTLPLHYMQAIKIPKGVIKHIDRVRRQFLWKGNQICRGINCLVSWDRVCALTTNGGMRILDLKTQN